MYVPMGLLLPAFRYIHEVPGCRPVRASTVMAGIV